MRDSLLDQDNAYFADIGRRCDSARMEARRLADAETIASDLGEWCRDMLFDTGLIETERKGHGLSDLLVFPTTHSPLQAFQRIPDATRQPLEAGFTALLEGRENGLRDALAWLFGQALARGLVDKLADGDEPAIHLLARLLRLMGSEEVARCAFEESFQERLHDSQSARSAILSELETRVRDINDDPGSGIYTNERQVFDAFVDAWRSGPSIADLWDSRGDELFVLHDALLKLLPCILPTDRSAVLNRLNSFDFPHLLRKILQHPKILHDRDEIGAVLQVAPTCSGDGRCWNGSLLVLLILQMAEKHCHALWHATHQAANSDDTDSDLRETAVATLSSWFEELGRIVMARPDSQFLGPQWLFMKAANERLGRAHLGHPSGQLPEYLQQIEVIEWIAVGLSKAGLTSGKITALVDFPKLTLDGPAPATRPVLPDSERVQPRLEALSMMGLIDHIDGNTSAENGQKLLDRLDALLASREPVFESEAHLCTGTRDLPASRFGYALANVEEPAKRWRKSWDFLVEQRRRAQHWHQTDDSAALDPSFFLLAVGMAGIDWLLSSHSHGKAMRLWRVLFDGMRECWLTVSLMHLRERIEARLGQLFARHRMVFGDAVAVGQEGASKPDMESAVIDYSELLAADLDFLGGDDLMVSICLLGAYRNGATPAVIDKVLKGNAGRVDAILRQFERWQQLERPVRRRAEVVEALTELRSKLQ